MPRVPRLTTPQVAPAVVREPTPELGQMPGMGVAQGVERLGAQVAQMVEQARQRGLAIRKNELEVEARRRANALLNDPEKGILNRQRQAAFDAPEQALDGWRKELDGMLADVRDPELREYVTALGQRLGASIEEQTFRHTRSQMDVVDKEQTDALRASLVEEIVGNATNPAVVGENLTRLDTLTRERLARQDVTDRAVVDAEVARVRSAARLAQIETLVDTNPEVARTMVEAHGDELVGKDKQAAQRMVRAGTIAVESQRAVDTLMAAHGEDERAALRAAREQYEGQMQDEVVRRLESRYADDRRLLRQEVEAVGNQGLMAVESGRPIPRAVLTFLEEKNRPDIIKALKDRQRQLATGEPRTTDLAALTEIYALSTEELAALDPTAYVARLGRSDYEQLLGWVKKAREGEPNPAATAAILDTYTFEVAKELGTVTADAPELLKDKGADRFKAMRREVAVEIAKRKAEFGRNLTLPEIKAAARSVLEADRLAELGVTRIDAPAPLPKVLNAPPLPANPARSYRRTRYDQLRAAGLTPEEALQQTIFEIP